MGICRRLAVRARKSWRSFRAAISRESSLRLGQLAHVRRLDHYRQLQPLRRAANQPLVGVAAPPTKPVIEMRHRQSPLMLPRQLMQHMQQHHRIRPAGNRHQDSLPRLEEPAGEDVLLDVVQQFAHFRMLFQQPDDARRIAPAIWHSLLADRQWPFSAAALPSLAVSLASEHAAAANGTAIAADCGT